MRRLAAFAPVLLVAASAAAASPDHPASDTEGRSTVEQTLAGEDPSRGFSFLRLGPGEPYLVRDDLAEPRGGRAARRRSLVYLAQLTDFQLSDEESPLRVDGGDALVPPLLIESSSGEEDPEGEDHQGVRQGSDDTGASAWRPQEALVAHQIELSLRQVNRFRRSPVRQGSGRRARMLNAVLTGDLADNAQRNETEWVVRLLEGGVVHPNGGTADVAAYDAFCRSLVAAGRLDPAEAPRYTGVQDYDDYLETPHFYDPDRPLGVYRERGWPTYPGLMDEAQQPFVAEGLKVPSYVLFGNHDALVQGNEDPNAAYDRVALGCLKPLAGAFQNLTRPQDTLDPEYLQGLARSDPDSVMVVPPDPARQLVDKAQFRALHRTGAQPDEHGFAHVDPRELEASDGSASYYSFTPRRGIRYIALDTVTQGGSFVYSPDPGGDGYVVSADDGNIDHPQWLWLERELERASERGELVLVFGHHAAGSMFFNLPDEAPDVPRCSRPDEHGHDVNPGCDRDPRPSTPLHFGDDLVALFHEHPHVIAYVAGHSHENRIRAFAREDGGRGGVWEIKSPATVDWPPQHRLIEVMDNRDGTLSIFATVLDHTAPAAAPPSGTAAAALGVPELGSIGRTLSYNDPQIGPGGQGGSTAVGPEGEPGDRNVELVLPDPREGRAALLGCRGRPAERSGSRRGDRLRGGRRGDRMAGGRGSDVLRGGRGRDTVCGGAGRDLVRGGRGGDRIEGGPGRDRLHGGPGPDRIRARDGARDSVRCGRGRDRAVVDRRDRVRGCERVRRR